MREIQALQWSMITIRKSSRLFVAAIAMMALLVPLSLPRSAAAAALTAAQANLINQGFTLFTTDTFNGNGRTCATCHIPQNDYTIGPKDIAALTVSAHNLLLATTPGLENPTVVNKLGSFNIGDNGADQGPSGIANPSNDGALFRTSMSIGGLAFTTANLCTNSAIIASINATSATTGTIAVTEPQGSEIFPGETILPHSSAFAGGKVTVNDPISGECNTNSGVIACTSFDITTTGSVTSCAGNCGTLTATAPCPGAKINPFGADDGNRGIGLGWAGRCAPIDASIIANPAGGAGTNCINVIDNFAANPTNLHLALESFTVGAVRKHSTRTRNRIPGLDFTCPTTAQLSALAAFQEYLGRQEELALCSNSSPSAICAGTEFGAGPFATGQKGTQASYSPNVVTFNDTAAETGKGIYLDSRSSCNLCHLNGGAQGTVGDIGSEQFLPGPPSLTNTATTWAASALYISATTGNLPGNTGIVSVVTPTDPANPYFFMALSCSSTPCTSGGSEPNWASADQLGDEVADGDITWVNLGVSAQRLNNPPNGALAGVSNSPGRNLSTPTDVDLLDVNSDNVLSKPTKPLNTLVGFTLPLDPGNLINGGASFSPSTILRLAITRLIFSQS